MPISIECPSCLRIYAVSPKAVGKKVKCACGESFVAEQPPQNVPGPPFAEFDEMEEEPTVPSIPSTANRDPQNNPQAGPDHHNRLNSHLGGFATAGRCLTFFGLLLIIICVFVPSTVHRPSGGGDAFEIRGRDFANISMIAQNLTVGLIGMTLLISGSIFWSASQQPPGIFAIGILIFLVASVFVGLFVQTALLYF